MKKRLATLGVTLVIPITGCQAPGAPPHRLYRRLQVTDSPVA